MRKKLILLALALTTAAAASLFPVRSAEAAKSCFLSCCDGVCHCCSRPCPPAC
jgi:hypothetical protein